MQQLFQCILLCNSILQDCTCLSLEVWIICNIGGHQRQAFFSMLVFRSLFSFVRHFCFVWVFWLLRSLHLSCLLLLMRSHVPICLSVIFLIVVFKTLSGILSSFLKHAYTTKGCYLLVSLQVCATLRLIFFSFCLVFPSYISPNILPSAGF